MLVTAHTYASANTWTPQAGLTESYDQPSGANSITGQSITGTWALQATPGPTGAKRSTAGGFADFGVTHILALRRFVPNSPPTVSLTSPVNGGTFNAPANITLTATASDSDGTIQKVEFFYGGSNLITTLTAAPYTFTWTNVPQGTYSLTARATDNSGSTTTSAPINVTVNAVVAQLYFIEVDHLNTPRLIENQSQQTVWRWDQQEPFGVNVPDENPSTLGAFEFPIRFPGQYADKETNLAYNYFRDYDSAIGRYLEVDPIGIASAWPGISVHEINHPYVYGEANPLSFRDPSGLISVDRENRSRERPDGREDRFPGPKSTSPTPGAAQIARFERCWNDCFRKQRPYCYLVPLACLAIGSRMGIGGGVAGFAVAVVVGDLCFQNSGKACTRICSREVFGSE